MYGLTEPVRGTARAGALLTALFLAQPAIAQQGAVIEPAGIGDAERGQVIATFYYSNSESGFDADGNRIDIPDYRKLELYLLTEFKVSDTLTLVVTPSLHDVQVEGPGNDVSGLGYTDIGARYRLADGDDWSLAVQGTARIPGDGQSAGGAQVVGTGAEYDFRARGFYGFAIGADSGFVDMQGSYRLRAGSPPNEFHADLTLGYRPVPDLLLLAQSFNTFSEGRGRGNADRYRYHNVQFSAVKQIAPDVSLQAGWVGTVAGENALRERGAFGGVWVSF